MKKDYIRIHQYPAIIWGEDSNKVFIYLHGQHGSKEDANLLAEIASKHHYQVISIDLPKHGERIREDAPFHPREIIPELKAVLSYINGHWNSVSLFANSIAAYFSLLAYCDEHFDKVLFVSPIINMKELILTMMSWANVSIAELEEKKVIPTNFGQELDWDYWQYAITHPILKWNTPTSILYGTKDTMMSRAIMEDFAKKFCMELTIIDGAEHWFHTNEQLRILRNWISQQIISDRL